MVEERTAPGPGGEAAASPSHPASRPSESAPQHARRVRPSVLVAIAAGGALGAPARYGVARLVPVEREAFPWATYSVNVGGALALGLLMALLLERFPPTRYARPFLGIGFLGSFTTFSTFAVEADMLVRDGRAGTAAAYVLATVLVGSAAAWAGLALGRALPRRARGPTRPAEEELR